MEYLTLAIFTVFMSILNGIGQEIAKDLKKAFQRYFHREEQH